MSARSEAKVHHAGGQGPFMALQAATVTPTTIARLTRQWATSARCSLNGLGSLPMESELHSLGCGTAEIEGQASLCATSSPMHLISASSEVRDMEFKAGAQFERVSIEGRWKPAESQRKRYRSP